MANTFLVILVRLTKNYLEKCIKTETVLELGV